ncbi:MAG TPA: DNA replication and repair protein RecF [Thermoanaerobaculia bacterium]|nr:DNA replication and repair protein RecF [Thermoanaerobaculia bacterium]
MRALHTENFRNLAPAQHFFHPTTNILVGRNGQGKTNLLEAIYFLATTRSFRTRRMASLFRFDAPTLFAGGRVERDGVERNLSAGMESGGARRRVLMINGERVGLAAYLEALVVFAYSAARLEIIRGEPEERRRFLDRGIASLGGGHLGLLTRFARVLRQRNALLAAVAAGEAPASELDAWDEEFVASGRAIQAAREAYTRDLAAALRSIIDEHDYHVRDVEMRYRPAAAEPAAVRRAELRARTSLWGPQRDALDFLAGGRPAAEVLSGGEMKTMVLFLKFAKLELFRRRFDEPPLFLLDDIDAELDLEILQRLLVRLPAATQVFATSAKESFLHVLRAGPHLRLTLDAGRVTTTREFA